jgi:hypothetical protein
MEDRSGLTDRPTDDPARRRLRSRGKREREIEIERV